MTVLLTAANGRTGRAVLSALAAAGAQVRVFIRDPQQWSALEALGAAEFAVGDMDDAASINDAVKGCERLVHIGPPMHPNEVEITGRLMDAAKRHGTDCFIYYSVMHPLLRDIRHHRLKLDAEQHLVESGLTYSIVQPSRYMQHLENIWSQVCDTNVHAMPFSIDQGFSVVDLKDLAEATARVAMEPGHEFATYQLSGPEALSQREMANIIGRLLGREVRAQQLDLNVMEEKARSKGVSDDRIAQMIAMNRHYDAHGFRGNPNVLQWLLGRRLTSFEEYVSRLIA
jgi:uncharacterized protein YbjT (DUF2867 family)